MQIRAARALLNMTAIELAGLVGISPRALTAIENGHALPRKRTHVALVAALEARGVIFSRHGDIEGIAIARAATHAVEGGQEA